MKPKGWFSRRHETRDANDRARAAYANRAVLRPRQRWNAEENRWEKFYDTMGQMRRVDAPS